MTSSRDNYQIVGNSIAEVTRNLNFLLQRMADRLDKLEGIRGSDPNIPTQDLNPTDTPSFVSLTISLTLEVDSTISVPDSNGTVIHQLKVGA